MSIHDSIRRVAAELNLNVSGQLVNRVAGTLRFARVRQASNLDPLIRQELQRLLSELRVEPASIEAATTDATFQQIDVSLQRGTCPRCGKQMTDVLLADYTPARFCEGECRITLWVPEKE